MTTSTDPITINLVDVWTAGLTTHRTCRKMELSAKGCAAIVDASGLTARFDVLRKSTDQLIISLANHIAALEKASDTARNAEIGESYSAGMRDGQACAGGGATERERDHFADVSKKVEAGMRAAHAEIHQLKEIRKDWATERDEAIARANKAERERDEAIATLVTTRAWRERDRTDLNSAMERTTNAIGRADKAEAEITRIQTAWGKRHASHADDMFVAYKERDAAITRAERVEAQLATDDAAIANMQSRDQARDSSLCRAVARADKAEKAEWAAKAWVATLIHERDSSALSADARKTEAELALAVRLVREWSALYGGTVYEVVGTRELLARHGG